MPQTCSVKTIENNVDVNYRRMRSHNKSTHDTGSRHKQRDRIPTGKVTGFTKTSFTLTSDDASRQYQSFRNHKTSSIDRKTQSQTNLSQHNDGYSGKTFQAKTMMNNPYANVYA